MAARCRRFPATVAEGKRGDVAASHRGLGQARGADNWHASFRQSSIHPGNSNSCCSCAAVVRVEGNCTGTLWWADGTTTRRLLVACCPGARFNFNTQSITAPGKNSLHAGGGMHPPIPPLYPPLDNEATWLKFSSCLQVLRTLTATNSLRQQPLVMPWEDTTESWSRRGPD